MFEHLNINSLRNKFNNLSELVKGSIDIFMVSAIALDDNFHSPIRSNHNKNDGGIILYVQKDIHVKLLSHDFSSTESYFVEIKLYKKKWLIKCLHKSNIRNHLDIIITSLDTHATKYDNIVILGEFNACDDDEALQSYCKTYLFNSFIKQSTCFKIPIIPATLT